jgi:addiction module HigA family antidote
MMTMHNPPHPGEMLRDDVLPALDLSVTVAARELGVTRAALSRVLYGHADISPEMALRIERWLVVEHGGCAGVWAECSSTAISGVRATARPRSVGRVQVHRPRSIS